MVEGITGLSYNMTFFVGLANFKGTGGAVMNTKNAQQFISVTKSNSLTVSTFGATKDPLVNSVDMQLVRVKVTDFFNPVQYLYYLKPVFTMPSNFRTPVGSTSVVPLNSVRVIKVASGSAATPASVGWKQACASADGHYIYANQSLLTLVDHAQTQPCVQTDLQMCYPPLSATSVVTFGLPLPIGFITAADLAMGPGNYPRLEAQFVVQAYDIAAKANVLTTLSMSVEITPLGFTAQCETASASQNLADVVSGNIYIGTATNDYEWNTLMQKKENMDVPGTPSNSLEFASTTVQGAVMTFAALGAPAYFEDPRYHGQSVHMRDIFTVHFLEPLSGRAGDPTPNFDAAKALFLAGGAFVTKTDAATHAMWLEPTPALLAICPLRPTVGRMACLTRIDSTYKNSQLKRSDNTVVELRMNDASSIVEMQGLMSQLLLQGGSNDFTNNLGSGFYAEISSKLALENRYRKAYVVNPIMNWRLDALVQTSQTGRSAYTVSSKIIGIGMITLQSASGTQLARRLLSMGLFDHDNIPGRIGAAPLEEWNSPVENDPYFSVGDDDDDEDNTTATEEEEEPVITPAPHAAIRRIRKGLRSLLQTSEGTLEPSMTQASNSMVVNLNIPDKTAVTQLCPVIGASAENCRGLQYTAQLQGEHALQLCAAEAQGTLSTLLDSGLRSALMPDSSFASNVTQVLMMHYSVSGCSALLADGAARRGLKQAGGNGRLVIVITDMLLSIENGQTVVVSDRAKQYVDFFTNATIMRQLLGGSAVLLSYDLGNMPPYVLMPDNSSFGYPNGTFPFNLSIVWGNVTNGNVSSIRIDGSKALTDYQSMLDKMFVLDRIQPPPPAVTPAPPSPAPPSKKSAGIREAGAAMAFNLLLAMSGAVVLLAL